MKDKTLLFVFHQSKFKANGGAISLVEIITKLKNVRPIVVTQNRSELTESLEKQNISCFYYAKDSNSFPGRILELFRWNFLIYKLVKKEAIELVHINDITSLWYSFFGVRLRRKHVIFNIRGLIETNRKYGLKWILVNFCYKVIVLSEEMKIELIKRLPIFNNRKFVKRVEVMYSLVDHSRFNSNKLVENPFIDQTYKHLLISASFNILKNQHSFISNVITQFKQSNVKFHFVGDFDITHNTYARQCYDLVNELDLNEIVQFHGYQGSIENYYKYAYLTLVTSKREGLARCMIESLACGTPVISFKVASAKEILIDHNCGIVVAQGEYNDFGSQISLLIANEDKHRELSANGIKAVSKLFNVERSIKRYEDITNDH